MQELVDLRLLVFTDLIAGADVVEIRVGAERGDDAFLQLFRVTSATADMSTTPTC